MAPVPESPGGSGPALYLTASQGKPRPDGTAGAFPIQASDDGPWRLQGRPQPLTAPNVSTRL
jgi:hypothetical protein